jgi:hypothetical protein
MCIVRFLVNTGSPSPGRTWSPAIPGRSNE